MQLDRSLDVALLGVVLPGVENHSLAVLGAALDAAGFAHAVIPFRGFAGMRAMIDDVLRRRPRICGISLQTTEAALATATFAHLLRAHGYAGTIVAGGHLASLDPGALLATGAIDVVVELAGEGALVGLARGDDPRSLPGTWTRDGRGAPPMPVRVRAMHRARPSEHLGFGAADLVVSRGCPAHCGYCCVAAVSDAHERAGSERHIVAGIDAIADEIADAASRGVRAFHFMDDNLLPLDRDAAIAWTRAMKAALAVRDVPPIACSLQLRADVVTPALAAALADLGLVRAYVGIDGYTRGQLLSLGRHASANAGTTALEHLHAQGILCVANALLVGPTIAFDSIVREIDGIAAVRHAPVHLLPIEARPGTIYHRRAHARGLVEGGPLWPLYRFADERTLLVGELVTKLPTRLVERSVPIALYDLAWALGVARRLAPQVDTRAGVATYARVTDAWNADQIRVLRAAVAAAASGRAAIDALLTEETSAVRRHDEALIRACDEALRDVERAMAIVHRRPVHAHARGRMLGGLAIAMGLAAACDSRARPGPDATTVVDAAPVADVAIDAPWVCADNQHEPSSLAGVTNDCNCFDMPTSVQITFDSDALITSVRDQDGAPLPADIERCFLDLVAGYCYPSYAGTTQTIVTCHSWIA